MIVNREPEPEHWRAMAGGGRPPPGWPLRLGVALTLAAAFFAVAWFAFDWWIARFMRLSAAGPDLGDTRFGDTATSSALWLSAAFLVVGAMSDRRCALWTRRFEWPVFPAEGAVGRRALLRHAALIALTTLVLFAGETAWLMHLLGDERARILAFEPCSGAPACRAAYAGHFDALQPAVARFLATHAALFAGGAVVIAVLARRSRALKGLVFSTPHGIFLFQRLDAFLLALLALAALLCALTPNIEHALVAHAGTLMAATRDGAAALSAPALTAMFAEPADNPLFYGVFLTGLICWLGAYLLGGFVRVASPYHAILEAHAVRVREGS